MVVVLEPELGRGQGPEDHAGGTEFLDRAVAGAVEVRGVVPGIGPVQAAIGGQRRREDGHESTFFRTSCGCATELYSSGQSDC